MDEKLIESQRKEQLVRCIPDVYNYYNMLYVGGHAKGGRNLQLSDEFIKRGYVIDVVEAFRDNVTEMRKAYTTGFRYINCGDIRNFMPNDKYDIVLWHHGPEHIEKKELVSTVRLMMKYTNKYIIFGCPFGVYPQGAEYGNPYEKHVSHWYPEDFESFGMKCDTIGERDVKCSNILTWIKL